MDESVKINEVINADGWVDKLIVIGADTERQAEEAASQWCLENNCRSGDLTLETKPVFEVKVITDDYS